MSLLALCYPNVNALTQSFLDHTREQYDLVYKDVVRPHFTMVFQVHDVPEKELAQHTKKVAARYEPFSFICRYAMVHHDDSSEDWYVFLVPEEGFSQIARFHDDLYTDFLEPKLRLDLPYIPHIGIATLKDRFLCKQVADDLNSQHMQVCGLIDSISVCSYDGKVIVDNYNFRLGSGAT